MIAYGKQDINQADIDAVVEVLQSDFLTQGPVTPAFEQALCDYTSAKHAVAVCNATAALHLACLALGLGKGDWLWTSPITFVASANCGLYCGAKVDFVDIDPKTYNLSPDALEKKLIQAKKDGCLPKIVIPVHLCGQSCDMEKIHALSQLYGFKIIEDASHAVGGSYQQRKVGSCQYSDITVFSFHPVKIITTAEGGVALSNDKTLADKMDRLRSHGVTRDKNLMTHQTDGGWYYQQIDLGFNYRMTEMQSALGLSQLKRLDEFVAKRHQLAQRYNELLADLPLTLPWQLPETYSGLHLYPIRLQLDKIDKSHTQVFDELRQNGIGVNLHYIPVHTQPYYCQFGFRVGDFPNAESYYAEAISLPMFSKMVEEQQDAVISVLRQILS